MTPPKFSAFLAEKIPDAQLVLVPKAGHYVMIEQPEAVDEALIPFLQKWA
jgi:pimeloyl-ACP methyl ester carboxylesterase